MRTTRTAIEGVWICDLEPNGDERGFFARTWCAQEFGKLGLADRVAQSNIAYSAKRGTLRGLHYQANPFWEEKLVRCVRGAAFVVAVDLRPDSPTHRAWVGIELTADNRRMIYVPKGCAQGYQTLSDDTELFYQMSQFYEPDAARGVAYDDPAFGIRWPLPVSVVSAKDSSWPPYKVPRELSLNGGRQEAAVPLTC